MQPCVGVIALQGGVVEHIRMFRSIGVDVRAIRLPVQLDGVSGLVVPGGESTTLMKLLERWGLAGPIGRLAEAGVPVWGTCAGAIVLCDHVSEAEHTIDQPTLRLARVGALRNAFGRQAHSFRQMLGVAGMIVAASRSANPRRRP